MNDIVKEGEEGEIAFMKWMDIEKVGYLRVDNTRESFSSIFSLGIKRPDFLVLLPTLGFIAIDVKHKGLYNGCFTISLENEVSKSMSFEIETRIFMWYAFKNKDNPKDMNWYFISAHKAFKKGESKTNRTDDSKFLLIDKKHFETIDKSKQFGKLYTQRIGLGGLVAKILERYFTSR